MDDYNKDILWECRGAAKFDKSTDDFLYFYNTLHKKIIKRELVRKPKYIFIVIKGQIHSVYDIVDVELIQPERNGRKFPKRYQINKIELNSEQTRKFRGNVVTDIFKKGAQSSTKYGNGLLNN